MSDDERSDGGKPPKKTKKLKLRKRALEPRADDLALPDEDIEDVKGGFAPPYTPVGPVHKDQ